MDGELIMNSKPNPSKEVVEQARLHPNEWIYQVEGDFAPEETVPPEAIVGAWSVDHEGNIKGDFVPNPNYAPKQKRPPLP
jgi:hypothetical protein